MNCLKASISLKYLKNKKEQEEQKGNRTQEVPSISERLKSYIFKEKSLEADKTFRFHFNPKEFDEELAVLPWYYYKKNNKLTSRGDDAMKNKTFPFFFVSVYVDNSVKNLTDNLETKDFETAANQIDRPNIKP